MTIKKLNSQGIAHHFMLAIVVVGMAIGGSYFMVRSFADTCDSNSAACAGTAAKPVAKGKCAITGAATAKAGKLYKFKTTVNNTGKIDFKAKHVENISVTKSKEYSKSTVDYGIVKSGKSSTFSGGFTAFSGTKLNIEVKNNNVGYSCSLSVPIQS